MAKLRLAVVYSTILLACITTCLVLFSFEIKRPVRTPTPIAVFSGGQLSSFSLFGTRFKYLLTSDVCDRDLDAVIIVTSYYGDVETRSAMRRAFSRGDLEGFKLGRVFLLGTVPEVTAPVKYKAIVDESRRFGDIVQGSFKEAYRNLTYKHLMGLHWASSSCNVKYILKMDDDIVVDVYKVMGLLKDFKDNSGYFLSGYVMKNMLPVREPANKWYVTRLEYFDDKYPPFLSGWFYITNPRTARALVERSRGDDYFWIDDVYVTGVLAKHIGARLVDIKRIFTVHPEFLRCCMHDLQTRGIDCGVVVGPNGGDNNLFYSFNRAMARCFYSKCQQRAKGHTVNTTCVSEIKTVIGRGKAQVENYKLFRR